MTWSTDKPTQPGWYWYRGNDYFDEDVIVEVKDSIGELCVFHYRFIAQGEDEVCPEPIESFRGQWAGPIPMPED